MSSDTPNRRILLAEDNPALAESIATLLRRRGFTVDHAADGVSALGRIASASPDLLILDLRLPRLHGIELLKKVRQSPKTANLAVIISTGVYKGDKYRQAAARLGVRHYLEKPYKADTLIAAIRDTLGSQTDPGRPLAAILIELFHDRFSGRVFLRSSAKEHCLTLLRGRPVGLEPGFAHADFGAWLQQRGEISAEEYAWYRHGRGGCHTALVELGCFDYPDLLQKKLTWLSTELVAGIGARGWQERREAFGLEEGPQVVAVNLPRVIYEGYHQHPAKQDPFAARLDSYPVLTENFFRYINFLRLDSDECALLPRLTGRQTLRQCLQDLDIGRALLRTLVDLGMLELRREPADSASCQDRPMRQLFNQPELADEAGATESGAAETFSDLVDDAEGIDIPAAEPAPTAAAAPDVAANSLEDEIRQLHQEFQGKNYYEIFGFRTGEFAFDKLKNRYFELTRKLGPETLMQLTGEAATLAEELLAQVSTAYNTLSDVVKKENYDQMLGSDRIGLGEEGDDRFQARVQFQSGKTFLEMEEWAEAEKALQDACNIDTGNGIYLANLAWAIYRNPKNSQSRAMMDKARQMLARALTLEKSGEGFAYRGWMHLDAGQDVLAEAEFTKALKLDPRQLLARKGLRQLQERREQEKKGLFKRMFG
ncbi:MAG: hypothetical protein Tsb0017_17230 [Geothermobacteraceae bacterium]